MSERRAQIVRLLETRDDGLPMPVHRDHTTSGFVHRAIAREACPDCLANDRTMFGCETCGGRGYTESLRDRDPYAVEKVQPYGIDVTRRERTLERDKQIDRLEQQTREPWKTAGDELADANAHPFGWEIERRRMYAEFDYAALDRELEHLRDVDEGAYRAVHAVYVYGWAEASTSIESACERGLRFLDDCLPDPLRAPAADDKAKLAEGRVSRAAGNGALAERDSAIRRAILEEGLPTADVANTWRLTTRQVNRIVAKGEVAA